MPDIHVTDTDTECDAYASVTSGGILVCNLDPGHDGALHFDEQDQIWWKVPDA
jgi:hypothetical protein